MSEQEKNPIIQGIENLLEINDTMKKFRELVGYVQNDSATVVKVYQDDATKSYIVSVGNKTYWGDSLREAINKAHKECNNN